jgi:hypothetical protein
MAEDQGQAQTGDLETEKIKSITAGLFESDYNLLQSVAGDLSVSRSMVVRSAVQNLFRQHRAGEISLAVEEGALVIQPKAQVATSAPAAKTSKKKKGKSASKKGKKKKKGTKPAKKKK